MKIDATGKPLASASVSSRSRVVSKKSGSDISSTSVVSVDIGSLASQMIAIEQDIRTQPTFDAEKVAAIKAAIANGEFQINPEAIADSLIESSRELLLLGKR